MNSRLSTAFRPLLQISLNISLLFRALAEGILADNPHLVLLFYLAQLFLRELIKSHRLVQVIPMDMSGYYGKISSSIVSFKKH